MFVRHVVFSHALRAIHFMMIIGELIRRVLQKKSRFSLLALGIKQLLSCLSLVIS